VADDDGDETADGQDDVVDWQSAWGEATGQHRIDVQ